MKFIQDKKKKDIKFKKNLEVERIPSGIKILREKRKFSEEKLEAATDKLKKEIVFSGSLATDKGDLRTLLQEMKKKREEKKIHKDNGDSSPTSRLSNTSELAELDRSPSGENKFPGIDKKSLPPDLILNERYRILELMNISNLSITYKGIDLITERHVMIKELKDEAMDLGAKQQAINQFKTEAKILFKIIHLNLPRYVDYFDYKYKRYLVTEYISGKNLAEIVKSNPGFMDENQVIKWSIQICEALSYLHNNKPEPVIFRNLKPENVIISEDGIVKLVDFGISKFFQESKNTLEIAKIINRYFSPFEQYSGQTDNRTDIYSLGALMYFALTAEKPVDALDISIDLKEMEFCRNINPHISPELDRLILKAMSEDKEDRYQNIEEVFEALMEILKTPRI